MRPPFLALLLTLLPLLGGCRYTFIPVIPERVAISLPPSLASASLLRRGDELLVSAALGGQITPGYLSVVWYDGDKELGRDSVYLDTELRRAEFRLQAPAKGSYRALLSFGGVLLRQVELRETGEL
ncbi:hypothetical protein [Deinococcus sp.]|uniref:hypothetical protein n=1 Tax=Deinococcus sp. TaxID=47478 RepID=UPI003CC57738